LTAEERWLLVTNHLVLDTPSLLLNGRSL